MMQGLWAAVVMIVTTGSNGSISYIPFYDMAACESAKVSAAPILPFLTRAVCVPTVTGNPGKHNDR